MNMRLGQGDMVKETDVPARVQDTIEEFTDVFATPTELPPTRG